MLCSRRRSSTALLRHWARYSSRGKDSSLIFQKLEDAFAWMDSHQQEECSEVYANLLRRSASLSDCRRIHEHIDKNGYYANAFLGNLLVQMYAKHGSIEDARSIFDKLRRKNIFSYSIMIIGYVQKGQAREALNVYRKMGLDPDCYVFTNVLRACAMLGPEALDEGRRAHEHMKRIWLKTDLYVDTALLNMYARCGSLKDAKLVFEELKWNRDIHFWNAMLVAYCQHEQLNEAIEHYKSMNDEQVEPNAVTYATVISVCTNLGDLELGRTIHSRLKKMNFPSDAAVENALVNMYAKAGNLDEARKVFDSTKKRTVVSWTGMITGYAQQGQPKEALDMYKQMEAAGVVPNGITFASVLAACATLGDLSEGEAIHRQMKEMDFVPDLVVQNALVNMYGKCGSLDEARAVFDSMEKKDVISWTALIAAYASHGRSDQALELYKQMDSEPNNMTYAAVLGACVKLGDLEQGRAVEQQIAESGCPADEVVKNLLKKLTA